MVIFTVVKLRTKLLIFPVLCALNVRRLKILIVLSFQNVFSVSFLSPNPVEARTIAFQLVSDNHITPYPAYQ